MSRNRLRSITRRLKSIQPPSVPIFLAPADDGSWTLVGHPERYLTEAEAVAAAHRTAAPARPLLMTIVFVDKRADCDDGGQQEAPTAVPPVPGPAQEAPHLS